MSFKFFRHSGSTSQLVQQLMVVISMPAMRLPEQCEDWGIGFQATCNLIPNCEA